MANSTFEQRMAYLGLGGNSSENNVSTPQNTPTAANPPSHNASGSQNTASPSTFEQRMAHLGLGGPTTPQPIPSVATNNQAYEAWKNQTADNGRRTSWTRANYLDKQQRQKEYDAAVEALKANNPEAYGSWVSQQLKDTSDIQTEKRVGKVIDRQQKEAETRFVEDNKDPSSMNDARLVYEDAKEKADQAKAKMTSLESTQYSGMAGRELFNRDAYNKARAEYEAAVAEMDAAEQAYRTAQNNYYAATAMRSDLKSVTPPQEQPMWNPAYGRVNPMAVTQNLEADRNMEQMTDEEQAVYDYVLATQGKEAADDFVSYMQESLNYRAGLARSDEIESRGRFGQFIGRTGTSLTSGLASGVIGIGDVFTGEARPTSEWEYAQMFNSERAADDGIQVRSEEYKALLSERNRLERLINNGQQPEENKEKLADVNSKIQAMEAAGTDRESWKIAGRSTAQIWNDVINNAGNQAASMALATINPVLGGISLGVSAAGNAKQEKLREGWDAADATTYGVLVGAAESALSKVLGGVAKFGGKKSLANTFTRNVDKIDNTFARFLANGAGHAIPEFTEEFIQTYLAPAFEAVILNTDYEDPGFEEALYSGLIGALYSIPMNMGGVRSATSERATLNTPTQPVSTLSPEVAVIQSILRGDVTQAQANMIANDAALSVAFQEVTGKPVSGNSAETRISSIMQTVQELTNKTQTEAPPPVQQQQQTMQQAPAPVESTSQQIYTTPQDELLTMLQRGRMSNTEASAILSLPEYVSAFRDVTGIDLTQLTNHEAIRVIQESARERAYSSAESERLAREAAEQAYAEEAAAEQQKSELSNTLQADQDIIAQLLAEGEARTQQAEQERARQQKAITEELDYLAQANGNEFYSYIRGMYLNGMTRDSAVEIYSNTKLRQAWEQIMNQKLPSKKNGAIAAIMDAGFPQDVNTASPNSAQNNADTAIEGSGDILVPPIQETASTEPSGVLNSKDSADVLPESAGVSQEQQNTPAETQQNATEEASSNPLIELYEEHMQPPPESLKEDSTSINTDPSDHTQDATPNENAETTELDFGDGNPTRSSSEPDFAGVEEYNQFMQEIHSPKGKNPNTAIAEQHVRQENTRENQQQLEAQRQAENAEAKAANASDLVGENARNVEAPTPEDTSAAMAKANFGNGVGQVKKATEAVDKIVSRIEFENSVNRKADDPPLRTATHKMAEEMHSVSEGKSDVKSFSDYYRRLQHGEASERQLFFPEVSEMLDQASANLYRERPDTERGNKLAADAMSLLARRTEQYDAASTEVYEKQKTIGNETEKMRKTKNFKLLLRGGEKRGLTMELLTPKNLLLMLDGYRSGDKSLGRRLNAKREKADIDYKTFIAEAHGKFNELTGRKDAEAFLSGKTKSNVRINGEQLSLLELAHMVRAYQSAMEQRRNAKKSDDIPALNGFAFGTRDDVKKVTFDKAFSLEFGTEAIKSASIEDIDNLVKYYESIVKHDDILGLYDKALTDMFAYAQPKLSDAFSNTNGYSMGEVGKYFPISYVSKNQTKHSGNDGDFFSTLGAVKERTRDAGGYLYVDPRGDLAERYIENAARYSAYAEFSNEMQMLNRGIDGALDLSDVAKNALGEEYANKLSQYINDLRFERSNKEKSFPERFAGKLRTNLGVAAIKLKLTTPIKQAAGTLAAGGVVDMKYLLMSQFGGGRKYGNLAENNPLFQHRKLAGMDATLGTMSEQTDTLMYKAIEKIPYLGKKWLNAVPAADVAAIKNIYKAACMQVSAENGFVDITKNPALMKKADDLFNRALLDTQSDTNNINNGSLYRSDSELAKAVTLFSSQQNSQLNNTFTAYMEAAAAEGSESKAAKAKARATGLAQVASSVEFAMLGVVANALLHKAGKWKDDEDEGEISVEKVLAELGDNAAETLFGVHLFGNVIYSVGKSAIQFASGKKADTIYNPSLGGLSTVLDVVSKTNRFFQNPSLKSGKDFALAISTGFGIPLPGAYDVVNAISLWTRDITRAVGGEEYDGNQYTDILQFLEKEIAHQDLITGKTMWERIEDMFTSDAPDDVRKATYNEIDALIGASGTSSFLPDRKKEGSKLSYDDDEFVLSDKEAKSYNEVVSDLYYDLLDDVVNSNYYKSMDDKGKVAIASTVEGYAVDEAKRAFFSKKDVEYSSNYDDEAELDSPVDYLVYKAAWGQADRIKDREGATSKEYLDTVDILLKGYKNLGEKEREMLDSSHSRVDDMYAAKEAGISPKTWNKYYDAYKEHNAAIAKDREQAKESGEYNYSATEAAREFAVSVESDGNLTPEQQSLIRNQMRFYYQVPGNTDSYDDLRDRGLLPDKALDVVEIIGQLEPEEGRDGIRYTQKYAAIHNADFLTEEEKFIAYDKYATDARRRMIAEGRAKGWNEERIFREYLNYN